MIGPGCSYLACLATALAVAGPSAAAKLPAGFCRLAEIDPSIVIELRYATANNFVGHPIIGYHAGPQAAVLTCAAARALARVQAELRPLRLGLKVFDAYRPQRATDFFFAWAMDPAAGGQRALFYPRHNKRSLFARGYIARRSGHARGSTVDLTLIRWRDGRPQTRPGDEGLDMGGRFDLFDRISFTAHRPLGARARRHRALLRRAMGRHGFVNYFREWWHFTLRPEPQPRRRFDFVVAPADRGGS